MVRLTRGQTVAVAVRKGKQAQPQLRTVPLPDVTDVDMESARGEEEEEEQNDDDEEEDGEEEIQVIGQRKRALSISESSEDDEEHEVGGTEASTTASSSTPGSPARKRARQFRHSLVATSRDTHAALAKALATVDRLTEALHRSETKQLASAATDSLVSGLTKQLECDLCYEPLSGPRVMSCGHTACGTCLAQWWRNKAVGMGEHPSLLMREKKCPFCNGVVRGRPAVNWSLKALVEAKEGKELLALRRPPEGQPSEGSGGRTAEDLWSGIFPDDTAVPANPNPNPNPNQQGAAPAAPDARPIPAQPQPAAPRQPTAGELHALHLQQHALQTQQRARMWRRVLQEQDQLREREERAVAEQAAAPQYRHHHSQQQQQQQLPQPALNQARPQQPLAVVDYTFDVGLFQPMPPPPRPQQVPAQPAASAAPGAGAYVTVPNAQRRVVQVQFPGFTRYMHVPLAYAQPQPRQPQQPQQQPQPQARPQLQFPLPIQQGMAAATQPAYVGGMNFPRPQPAPGNPGGVAVDAALRPGAAQPPPAQAPPAPLAGGGAAAPRPPPPNPAGGAARNLPLDERFLRGMEEAEVFWRDIERGHAARAERLRVEAEQAPRRVADHAGFIRAIEARLRANEARFSAIDAEMQAAAATATTQTAPRAQEPRSASTAPAEGRRLPPGPLGSGSLRVDGAGSGRGGAEEQQQQQQSPVAGPSTSAAGKGHPPVNLYQHAGPSRTGASGERQVDSTAPWPARAPPESAAGAVDPATRVEPAGSLRTRDALMALFERTHRLGNWSGRAGTGNSAL